MSPRFIRSNWRTALVAACAVVLVAALGLTWVLGGDDQEAARSTPGDPSAAATATPSPGSPRPADPSVPPAPKGWDTAPAVKGLSAKQQSTARAADDRLRGFLKASSEQLAENPGKVTGLSSYAAGPALGEMEALAQQYELEEQTIEGAPKVLSVTTRSVDLDAKPPTVVLAACLDNSPVIVRDARGRNLTKDRRPSEVRVLNIYRVHEIGGKWRVVDHSIPSNSACPGTGS